MSRTPIPELLAPLPLGAVALMAVNDAWLKPAFHDAVTGKLSDFAICFFLPLFLSALLGMVRVPLRPRLGVGALATLVVFTALKISPAAARLFEAALGQLGRPLGMHAFRATVDPTDLIALPFVFLALWHARHLLGPDSKQEPFVCAESPQPSSASPSSLVPPSC